MASSSENKTSKDDTKIISEHVEDESDNETKGVTKKDIDGDNKSTYNPRDLITADHMDPTKLKDIKVFSNRADVMSDQDEATFAKCMKDFATIVFGKEPDEKEFLTFYISLVQCWLNQSTSMKNAKQMNLTNTLMHGDQKKTWRTADFINYVKGNLPHVPNPFRQYARAHEHEIEILKATGKVTVDHHLQAKHGVLPQFWNVPADYVNGSLMNISEDDLAANLLMKCQALKRNEKEKKYYNVSQLGPGGCGN
uniref:Coat protein n=34 Tax=Cucurbit yellow stunting disorder virus TaxID=51330 RepID=A0A3B0J6K9_9CLOS|nr:coat protein [Cucurbit yellow stunting disorder virus]SPN63236.1 coat protein [Cucurbit yellow stunting disorder virus]